MLMFFTGKTFSFTSTAAKRRISKNMISEPKNFEHLIHTETEEEATIIFKEWMRNPSAGKLPGKHLFSSLNCFALHQKTRNTIDMCANAPCSCLPLPSLRVPSKVSQLKFDLVKQEDSSTFATPPETLKGPTFQTKLAQQNPHARDASYATFVIAENDDSEGGFSGAGWDNDEIERSMVPSLSTVEQSSSTKIFFESYYHRLLTNPSGRSRRRLQLERQLESLGISEDDKTEMRQEWMANETEYMRLLREKISVNSFLILKTIGHGAFGVVKLVQEKDTGLYFAMKVMRKADMLKKGQEGHVRAERDLMTAASESAVWIVKLIYSFQDADHLYLVMEYMSGGDLLNLLIEKDIFEEDFAKFYVAEMVLCIEEAHKLGYIHRDIKV
jgi:hypothetical protein